MPALRGVHAQRVVPVAPRVHVPGRPARRALPLRLAGQARATPGAVEGRVVAGDEHDGMERAFPGRLIADPQERLDLPVPPVQPEALPQLFPALGADGVGIRGQHTARGGELGEQRIRDGHAIHREGTQVGAAYRGLVLEQARVGPSPEVEPRLRALTLGGALHRRACRHAHHAHLGRVIEHARRVDAIGDPGPIGIRPAGGRCRSAARAGEQRGDRGRAQGSGPLLDQAGHCP